jgi:GH24 family phage-related lysozyme (muramidase)
MARLTIDQIRAPDLSVASKATQRAGASFQEGMNKASKLISDYQAGIESAGDAEIFQEVAQLGTEEEYNNFINTTDLSKRHMSQAMRERIMAGRNTVLGYERGRAVTDNTLNNTRINTNVDNRAGRLSDLNYKTRIDTNKVNALSAGINTNNLSYGVTKSFEGNTTTPYNDPRTDKNGNPIGDPIYRSGYGSDTYTTEDGKVHKVTKEYGGTPADAERDFARRNEKIYNPTIRSNIGDAAFSNLNPIQLGVVQSLLHNFGSGAFNSSLKTVRGALASGNKQAVADAILRLKGLNGGINDSRREKEAQLFLNGGANQQPTLNKTTQNPYVKQNSDTDRLNQLLSDPNLMLAPGTRSNIILENINSTKQGQEAIDRDNQLKLKKVADSLILAASEDNIDPVEAQLSALNSVKTMGLDPTEELAVINAIKSSSTEGGNLSAERLQLGTLGLSQTDKGIAESIYSDISEKQMSNSFLVALSGAREFQQNPAESLRSALRNLKITDIPAELDGEIDRLANSLNITRSQAAYSFARAGGDNRGVNANSIFSPFGDNLSQNKAKDFAVKYFKGVDAAKARAKLSSDNQVISEVKRITNKLGKLERKIQKNKIYNKPISKNMFKQRDELKKELNVLYEKHGIRLGKNSNTIKMDNPKKVSGIMGNFNNIISHTVDFINPISDNKVSDAFGLGNDFTTGSLNNLFNDLGLLNTNPDVVTKLEAPSKPSQSFAADSIMKAVGPPSNVNPSKDAIDELRTYLDSLR